MSRPIPEGEPSVSVVMPVHNGARFLPEAIESILGQTLTDLELVIVDDGSTDATSEVLASYALRDRRVVVEPRSHLGASAARNWGFTRARAGLVACLDADDVAAPDRLERQRGFLADHERVAVVGGAVRFVDAAGTRFADETYPTSAEAIRATLDWSSPLAHSAAMVRKDAWRDAGGYRELFTLAQDVDLWLRIAERHDLANLPEIVVRYRIHPQQGSKAGVEAQSLEALVARAAARARRAGRPDPLADADALDPPLVEALGLTPEDVAAAFVADATWLAKTMARAGYANVADELFAAAQARALLARGSSELVARVEQERRRVQPRRRLPVAGPLVAPGAADLMRAARELLLAAARRLAWLAVIPLLRLRARRRVGRLLSGGITVVTVNWNSRPFLEALLRIVAARSPANVRILVVDNGSQDGSRELLARDARVKTVQLPFNLGHDLALDIGFLLAETEFVVALDIDAFPLRADWLDRLLEPLASGCEIAGAHLNREYVHPCCLMMRTARFVERGHSFRSRYQPRTSERDASGDIGELISAREPGRLHFLEVTSQRGPGDVGTVFGEVVYHNFYSTRFAATDDAVLDVAVERDDPKAAWDEALSRYDV